MSFSIQIHIENVDPDVILNAEYGPNRKEIALPRYTAPNSFFCSEHSNTWKEMSNLNDSHYTSLIQI